MDAITDKQLELMLEHIANMIAFSVFGATILTLIIKKIWFKD